MQMRLKFFSCGSKAVIRITASLAIGSLLSVSNPAKAATMTVFKKGNTSVVVNLKTVKDITFVGATAVGDVIPKPVTYSLSAARLSGNFLFRLSGQPRSSVALKLYSINGRLIYSQTLKLNEIGKFSATLPHTVPGFYLARYVNEKHTISQRVLIY